MTGAHQLHTPEPVRLRRAHRELRSTAERQGRALSWWFKSTLPDNLLSFDSTPLQRGTLIGVHE